MRQDVEQIINNTKIDETKLPEAMRIIDRAASIMEKEALLDFWTDFLEIEMGIDEVMDYLFTENDKGEIAYAPVDEVMERIRKGKALAEENVILS